MTPPAIGGERIWFSGHSSVRCLNLSVNTCYACRVITLLVTS